MHENQSVPHIPPIPPRSSLGFGAGLSSGSVGCVASVGSAVSIVSAVSSTVSVRVGVDRLSSRLIFLGANACANGSILLLLLLLLPLELLLSPLNGCFHQVASNTSSSTRGENSQPGDFYILRTVLPYSMDHGLYLDHDHDYGLDLDPHPVLEHDGHAQARVDKGELYEPFIAFLPLPLPLAS